MTRRLCTVCARGGSKGVVGKNVRCVGGLPLIAHTLRQAAESKLFEHIVVSSDADDVLSIAEQHGATLVERRPAELATDNAPKIPAIQHCVDATEERVGHTFDVVVDLDATAPLRLPSDIVGAVLLLERSDASNVITGCPARRSPYFNLVELTEAGQIRLSKQVEPPVFRRQDAPPCWDMNASIYVWRRNALAAATSVFLPDTALFEMPEHRSIDIDTELDLELVEFLLPRLERLPP